MPDAPRHPAARRAKPAWTDLFATGLAHAVGAAVDVAGGATDSLAGERPRKTRWRQALDWFVSSYPLLGALADAFKLVEDPKVCRTHDIRVAAISPVAAELYVNPACDLEQGELRFVIAHELLHAGLRHDTRAGGRDPWLSAEQVYDKIAADRRRMRKLATLRGYGTSSTAAACATASGITGPADAGCCPPGWSRPGWYTPPEAVESRTFGVVLDTSGSMDVRLLGKALGAIASYAVACFLLLSCLHAIFIWCPAFLHGPVLTWLPFNGERWPRLFIGGITCLPSHCRHAGSGPVRTVRLPTTRVGPLRSGSPS